MPTPTNRGAYGTYYDVLDRAIESKAGIRIEQPNRGDAYQYRVRLHKARSYDRDLNRESRTPDDPSYGRSDYDNLVVRVRREDGQWWVYIEPAAIPTKIEELSCAPSASPTDGPRANPLSASSVTNSATPKRTLGLIGNIRRTHGNS
jgi:hypothetical protein